MSLILAEQTVGPITLLELGERLTSDTIPEFRDAFEKLVLAGHRLLLLDCSRINTVDSQGIGALAAYWISLRKRGGSLKLLNPSPRLGQVLRIVNLHKVIESFGNMSVALFLTVFCQQPIQKLQCRTVTAPAPHPTRQTEKLHASRWTRATSSVKRSRIP